MVRPSVRWLFRSRRLTRLGLTPGQSLVLIVLLDHADATGLSFPAQQTIAEESGMERSGVRKALAALVDSGVIEVVEPGGPRKSARYRISSAVGLWATG